MAVRKSCEIQRDLLTGMAYHRGTTLVTQRTYSYDTLGRPLTRSTARNGQTVNDSFVHNSRSELASATVNGSTYGYDYDNIGNRRLSMEASDYSLYEANSLNQYTSIQANEDTVFAPTFDANGNQTLVKTSTGVWSVVYNAENRPIRFTNADGSTVIECSYDTHGRRATKKVTSNGSVTLHQRYIYRGYLQIASCDLTRSNHPCLWLLTWVPTQTIATRPLAIRKDGSWFAYGWDLTKNICEVFGPAGYIRTNYTYSPYGEVIASGDVTQPIQWSSEYYDLETSVIYYNYRYYNPSMGRWITRDMIQEDSLEALSLYHYVENRTITAHDVLGLYSWGDFALDALSVLAIAADIALAGPTGEGFAATAALQAAKTGAKAVAKAGAKSGAKAGAKSTGKEASKAKGKKRGKKEKTDYGNCTPARHSELHKAVGRACKNKPFSCPDVDLSCKLDCKTIAERIVIGTGCISARMRISKECFNGADKEHNDEIINATKGVDRCRRLFESKNCI